MAKKTDRIVYKTEDGDWANKRIGADRAAGLHGTQRAAEQEAKGMIRRDGGGELITKGEDGKIRSKDTIGGNDPCPPRDTEH